VPKTNLTISLKRDMLSNTHNIIIYEFFALSFSELIFSRILGFTHRRNFAFDLIYLKVGLAVIHGFFFFPFEQPAIDTTMPNRISNEKKRNAFPVSPTNL